MAGRCYLIDPGADFVRLYDPKTKEIHSIRSCRLDHHPDSIGSQALCDIWKYPKDRLVYPFFAQKVEKDPSVLLRHLFEKAPVDRFWMLPRACILSLDSKDEEDLARWNRLLDFARCGTVSLICPFPVIKDQPLFHIHCGASQTLFVLSNGNGWMDLRPVYIGGLAMDKAIQEKIAADWRVLISMEDARALKEAASRGFHEKRNPHLKVTGLDQRQGFVEIDFPASSLWPAMEKVISAIAHAASSALCAHGPETMELLSSRPALLSGGMAECYGLLPYLEQYLKTDVETVSDPANWLIRKAAGG